MTHCNSFVLAIKDSKRQVLREYDGKVYLPFHSEYSLFLKNTGSVRALATVEIDGTDVLGGNGLVIPAWGHVDLERFIPSDKKFKFVPAGDSRVQDPTSGDNGLIKVTFKREYIHYQPMIFGATTTYTSSNSPGGFNMLRSKSVNDGATIGAFACSTAPVECCDMGSVGATVEGSKSNQTFQDIGSFATEGMSTILTLKLLGNEAAVTVKATKNQYCPGCGTKARFADNFCGTCGTKL
jgi:hypothetical protein